MNCQTCNTTVASTTRFVCKQCFDHHYLSRYIRSLDQTKQSLHKLSPSLSSALSSVTSSQSLLSERQLYQDFVNVNIQYNHNRLLEEKWHSLNSELNYLNNQIKFHQHSIQSLHSLATEREPMKSSSCSSFIASPHVSMIQRQLLSRIFSQAMFVCDSFTISVCRTTLVAPYSDYASLSSFCTLLRGVCTILFHPNPSPLMPMFNPETFLDNDLFALNSALMIFASRCAACCNSIAFFSNIKSKKSH
ncbi:hypothetical protein GEMRC1_011204 [Eukaryota sp. GEM-RC1]